MEIFSVSTPRVERHPPGAVQDWVCDSLQDADHFLKDGDILFVSAKLISYFEDRIVELESVQLSDEGRSIASQMNAADPRLIQLVMNEADKLVKVTPWVLLTIKDGIYSANAGVDTSNVEEGFAVLWPEDSFRSAEQLRQVLMERFSLKTFGVVIVDSCCVPGRIGTMGVAIGYCGLRGYDDLKGSMDLFGNVLRYSSLNIVDSLATAANVVMGESADAKPLVIVREFDFESVQVTKKDEMLIPPSDDLYQL